MNHADGQITRCAARADRIGGCLIWPAARLQPEDLQQAVEGTQCSRFITLATVPTNRLAISVPFLNSLPRLTDLNIRGGTSMCVEISGMALCSMTASIRSLSLTYRHDIKAECKKATSASGYSRLWHGGELTSEGEEDLEREESRKEARKGSCKLVLGNLGMFLQPWRHSLVHLHMENCYTEGYAHFEQGRLFAQFPHLCTLRLISSSASSAKGMTTLNLSGCKSLKLLDCCGSGVYALNMSGCGVLEHLHCQRNALSVLSLSDCVNLVMVDCEHNQLTGLSLAHCPRLKQLYGRNKLAYIALDPSAHLDTVSCAGKGHSPVILGGAFISSLLCSTDSLTWSVHLRCHNLVRLSLRNSFVTSTVNGFRDLKYLRCKFGPTGTGMVDLTGCTAVEVECRCEATILPVLIQITGRNTVHKLALQQLGKWSPDLRGFSNLRELRVTLHLQVSLDLSACMALHTLRLDMVPMCPLATLRLSGCVLLEKVVCDGFKDLMGIDLESCASLKSLSCKGSFLQILDASACPLLKLLDVSGSNRLQLVATSKLVQQLEIKSVGCRELDVTSDGNLELEVSPNWRTADWHDQLARLKVHQVPLKRH